MDQTDRVCRYWDPGECEGTRHCPPRCPRFVDREGSSWVIRPAADGDHEALVDMYDDFAPGQAAQGLPPRKRSRIAGWLDGLLDEGCNFLVVGETGIVGHALYTPTDDAEPEFAVFVHQDYQGRGIGTELSKHVVAAAAVADREALTLIVDPDNRTARRLYEKLGFEVVEELPYEERGRRTAILRLRRPLDDRDGIEYQHVPIVGTRVDGRR
ncbi:MULTISPECIES: GNAT family N-acetyltransferase [Halomicrobium]|uniref:GCN5-related N-acetyltransferase n=2 Tax=Halomicrobium mukohataei TaxID=57705 RepID=C7NXR6_HALMD|nr:MULTISPECIES: GNAT family N-acetyltransferase [Halomicrobium]ACV46504.1 GCN5-related N-acetyltransferase [Halomicrobium mukohataei DSM 12286]QCD65050.1 GNAT family N-acetyltransferase [Halomicrobium mukohataei]QFR19856.1 GNAT family N-acetyltransferase [Halomicrobium sp. ZPS1]